MSTLWMRLSCHWRTLFSIFWPFVHIISVSFLLNFLGKISNYVLLKADIYKRRIERKMTKVVGLIERLMISDSRTWFDYGMFFCYRWTGYTLKEKLYGEESKSFVHIWKFEKEKKEFLYRFDEVIKCLPNELETLSVID